jgi:hypothetical protein
MMNVYHSPAISFLFLVTHEEIHLGIHLEDIKTQTWDGTHRYQGNGEEPQ